MKRNRLGRNRSLLNRSLRVESLESRSLMAYLADYALPSENVQARDDHFVLKADSSRNSLAVLNNDQWSWRIPSRYVVDSSASLQASLVTNDVADPGRFRSVFPSPFQILSVSPPKNGTVSISEDKKSLLYTPDKNFEGIDQFEYTIDGASRKIQELLSISMLFNLCSRSMTGSM